jgi:hypothetical protein
VLSRILIGSSEASWIMNIPHTVFGASRPTSGGGDRNHMVVETLFLVFPGRSRGIEPTGSVLPFSRLFSVCVGGGAGGIVHYFREL